MKLSVIFDDVGIISQPPSGGCVLKRKTIEKTGDDKNPAAFGRLCVETWPSAAEKTKTPSSRLRAAVC